MYNIFVKGENKNEKRKMFVQRVFYSLKKPPNRGGFFRLNVLDGCVFAAPVHAICFAFACNGGVYFPR